MKKKRPLECFMWQIIFLFEEIHSEMEKIVICDELIKDWTYPLIQPKLIEEAARRGHV
mgnify:CR=1 FL=1